MFQLYTSEDVLAETVSKLRDNHPRWDGAQTSRVRGAIMEVFDGIIEDFDGAVDYQGLDPDDFHVHAATLAANANILLTCDNGLLNQPNADELSYEAFHPDDFFVLVNDSAPLSVRSATLDQIRYLQRRYGDRKTKLVDSLLGSACPQFAEIARLHLIDLAGEMTRGERRNLRRAERLTHEASSQVRTA
jgi:predicted nucleic acid-binding protein